MLGVLGFIVLPLVGPLSAIVFAGMADEEIAASGGTVGGEGFADAGRILGIVGLVLAAIVITFTVLPFTVLDWSVVRIERLDAPEIALRFVPAEAFASVLAALLAADRFCSTREG